MLGHLKEEATAGGEDAAEEGLAAAAHSPVDVNAVTERG